VTEKRAPTDESVRLLREMEAAAVANVIKSIQIVDNSVNCSMHVQNNMLSGTKDIIVIYSLNGKRGEFEFSHRDLSRDDMIRSLIQKFGEHLAVSMLEKPFNEALKSAF
jgi:hypothetical protein